jgi:hypothetical protein
MSLSMRQSAEKELESTTPIKNEFIKVATGATQVKEDVNTSFTFTDAF